MTVGEAVVGARVVVPSVVDLEDSEEEEDVVEVVATSEVVVSMLLTGRLSATHSDGRPTTQ